KALFLLVTPSFVSGKLFCPADFSPEIHSSFVVKYYVLVYGDDDCGCTVFKIDPQFKLFVL
ncbi:hypothetical protein WUBG_03959, partial [Wuchereria bancrofti]